MRDPLYRVPIKYKLALTFVLLGLVSLGTGGAVAYHTAKSALRDQILENVRIYTSARAASVHGFLESLKKRTEDFSSDGFIRDAVSEIVRGDRALRESLNQHLLNNKVAIVPAFFETLAVGRDGTVLASSIPANVGLDLSTHPCILKARSQVYRGDIHAARAGVEQPSFEVCAPLTDRGSHEFIGILVNRVSAESLSRAVMNPPPIETGSTAGTDGKHPDYYLIDGEGFFLSATRAVSFAEAFMTRKVPLPLSSADVVDDLRHAPTPASRQPSAVESGSRQGYQGTDVLSAWVGIEGTQWTLVSEIDARSAFGAVTVLRNRLGMVALVLGCLMALLLVFPSKFMIEPIQRLCDAARRIEAGDFNADVEVDSNDEIGELAHAFNEMARGLRERDEIEKRLFQHEKMMVIGEMSAAFAHELNTPLASIAMFSQMLVDDLPADSPHREHLGVILRNALTCKLTVRSLLGSTGARGSEKEPIRVDECLQEVVGLCRPLLERSRIRQRFELDVDVPTCTGDRERLRQVFVNLTMNAIQAMGKGGILTVRLRRSGDEGAENVVVEFCDTGEGIDPQHVTKIFEPFFTTKPEGVGTGLGLSIARRVITEHGGRIEAAASPTGGARFVITLPASQQQEAYTVA